MQPRLALLDTNILLLWLAGNTDFSLLTRFKRVNMFSVADFLRLQAALARFSGQVTTPHVLAEVSNYCGQAPLLYRAPLARSLGLFIESFREEHTPAKQLVQRDICSRLGITDTGLAELARIATVITTDNELFGTIMSQGGGCVHFQSLRDNGTSERRNG